MHFNWRPALLIATLASTLPFSAQSPPAQFVDGTPTRGFSYITRNDYTTRKYFLQPMTGGVAILDFDNDGLEDIFFTNGSAIPAMKKTSPVFDNCLLRNVNGKWEDRTAAAGLLGRDLGYVIGAAAADYDNDGF